MPPKKQNDFNFMDWVRYNPGGYTDEDALRLITGYSDPNEYDVVEDPLDYANNIKYGMRKVRGASYITGINKTRVYMPGEQSWIDYYKYNAEPSRLLFRELDHDDIYPERGKSMGSIVPRDSTNFWRGGEVQTYKFAGKKHVPRKDIPDHLEEFYDFMEDLYPGQQFNFAVVNRYKSSCDSISAHADDEEEIIPNSEIASLSLGATRDFIITNNPKIDKADWVALPEGRNQNSLKITLKNGDIIVMGGNFQEQFYHHVPKCKGTEDKSQNAKRINITLRQFVRKNQEAIMSKKPQPQPRGIRKGKTVQPVPVEVPQHTEREARAEARAVKAREQLNAEFTKQATSRPGGPANNTRSQAQGFDQYNSGQVTGVITNSLKIQEYVVRREPPNEQYPEGRAYDVVNPDNHYIILNPIDTSEQARDRVNNPNNPLNAVRALGLGKTVIVIFNFQYPQHWTGAVIKRTGNDPIEYTAYYIDPLGDTYPIRGPNTMAHAFFRELGTKVRLDDIHEFQIVQQNDGTSCGPLTAANMILLAQIDGSSDDLEEQLKQYSDRQVEQLREQQLKLLEQSEEGVIAAKGGPNAIAEPHELDVNDPKVAEWRKKDAQKRVDRRKADKAAAAAAKGAPAKEATAAAEEDEDDIPIRTLVNNKRRKEAAAAAGRSKYRKFIIRRKAAEKRPKKKVRFNDDEGEGEGDEGDEGEGGGDEVEDDPNANDVFIEDDNGEGEQEVRDGMPEGEIGKKVGRERAVRMGPYRPGFHPGGPNNPNEGGTPHFTKYLYNTEDDVPLALDREVTLDERETKDDNESYRSLAGELLAYARWGNTQRRDIGDLVVRGNNALLRDRIITGAQYDARNARIRKRDAFGAPGAPKWNARQTYEEYKDKDPLVVGYNIGKKIKKYVAEASNIWPTFAMPHNPAYLAI